MKIHKILPAGGEKEYKMILVCILPSQKWLVLFSVTSSSDEPSLFLSCSFGVWIFH